MASQLNRSTPAAGSPSPESGAALASRGIAGRTAEEIALSIRTLVDEGRLQPGDALPPVRTLAETLGVNRNTALTAYRLLVQARLAQTRGRAGTVIAHPFHDLAEEGFTAAGPLRDIGDGNPDRAFLPDPSLARIEPAPAILYGEPTVDPGLADWATRWIGRDQPRPFRLTVTAGAVHAVELLLEQALAPGDAVALEDPCFLTSISMTKQNGYRAVPVSMDEAGMLPASLEAALGAGARAVICTPRAHNPTGAALTATRAAELRDVLSGYPHVLVIEDDHFALLSRSPYETIIGARHRRFGLVRSLSKALGPDMRLALVASDPESAARMGQRISGGITWVSHLLQRLAHAMLVDPEAQHLIRSAGQHYSRRNDRFVASASSAGLRVERADGLNVWVSTAAPAAEVLSRLERRGWSARAGAAFALDGDGGSTPGARHAHHLRLTVHRLNDAELDELSSDLAEAAGNALAAARQAGPAFHHAPG